MTDRNLDSLSWQRRRSVSILVGAGAGALCALVILRARHGQEAWPLTLLLIISLVGMITGLGCSLRTSRSLKTRRAAKSPNKSAFIVTLVLIGVAVSLIPRTMQLVGVFGLSLYAIYFPVLALATPDPPPFMRGESEA